MLKSMFNRWRKQRQQSEPEQQDAPQNATPCEPSGTAKPVLPQRPEPDVVLIRFVRKSTLLELNRKTGKLDGHTFDGPPLPVFVESLSEKERLFAAYAYIVDGRALRVTLLRDNGEAALVEMPCATYFGLEMSKWDRAEQPPPRWVWHLLELKAKHRTRTQARR